MFWHFSNNYDPFWEAKNLNMFLFHRRDALNDVYIKIKKDAIFPTSQHFLVNFVAEFMSQDAAELMDLSGNQTSTHWQPLLLKIGDMCWFNSNLARKLLQKHQPFFLTRSVPLRCKIYFTREASFSWHSCNESLVLYKCTNYWAIFAVQLWY